MGKKVRTPRAVLVTRPTEYQSLLNQHGTHGQVEFFLESRGQTIRSVVERHERQLVAVQQVSAGVPLEWRRATVCRSQLDRFLWGPDDVVLAVGQDGLVANVAKYLSGQSVIGVNPDPERYDGVLVRHSVESGLDRLLEAGRGECEVERRTMVEARTDTGQSLLALNEIFVGHSSHQSARYLIGHGGEREVQSSSGLIVASGTGATGWARSICRQRALTPELPGPTDQHVAYFVREAFPSKSTGCTLTQGLLRRREELTVISRMNSGGVIFGDGIESDRIEFDWGRHVTLSVSKRTLELVV